MRPIEEPTPGDLELDECPDCTQPWPAAARACPFCGLEIEEVAERVASENPRYGSGNPDWARDFERTRE